MSQKQSDSSKGYASRSQAPGQGGRIRQLQSLPEIQMLVDGNGLVLKVTSDYAGERLRHVKYSAVASVHEVFHPECQDAACTFALAWRAAWDRHRTGSKAEWEIEDPANGIVLRMRLRWMARLGQGADDDAQCMQDRISVLTLKDITESRRTTRNLRERTLELSERFRRRSIELSEAEDNVSDGSGNPAVTVAMENARNTPSNDMLMVQEEERKRLASDLHDGLGQSLSSLKYTLEQCRDHVAGLGSALALRLADQAVELSVTCMKDLRDTLHNLRPLLLEQIGLMATIDLVCYEFHMSAPQTTVLTEFEGSDADIPDPIVVAIFRVLQEALNNVAKHAQASRVNVSIRNVNQRVILVIQDDGKGLNCRDEKKQKYSGYGMSTMRQRVESSNGSFACSSPSGKGTTVTAVWDLRPDEDD